MYQKNSFLNLILVLGVIVIFSIAIVLLYFVNDWFLVRENIYQQSTLGHIKTENEKWIFMIGSSHVNVLNYIFIDKYISSNLGSNYKIFNFGKGTDTPTKRINDVNDIISAKPDFVIYGIDYFDLHTRGGKTY